MIDMQRRRIVRFFSVFESEEARDKRDALDVRRYYGAVMLYDDGTWACYNGDHGQDELLRVLVTDNAQLSDDTAIGFDHSNDFERAVTLRLQ